MTSKEDIRSWLADGLGKQATHMLVCCDRFEMRNYPVLVMSDQDINAVVQSYRREGGLLSSVTEMSDDLIEVYSYGMDIEDQLAEERAWHPEPWSRPAVIDIAKPISVLVSVVHPRLLTVAATDSKGFLVLTNEAEAYRRLFEAAPKMLALLKDIDKEGHCDIYDCDHASHKIPFLVAEIEGSAT